MSSLTLLWQPRFRALFYKIISRFTYWIIVSRSILFIITVDLIQAFGWKHCLQYLLGQLQYPEEMKSKGYAKLWRANEVFYGRCENGELKKNLNIEWLNGRCWFKFQQCSTVFITRSFFFYFHLYIYMYFCFTSILFFSVCFLSIL